MSRLLGARADKRQRGARRATTLAFGRLDHAATGDALIAATPRGADGISPKRSSPAPDPVHALALKVKDRKDEMRLAAAMAKLIDEDPSLVFVHDQELSEIKLLGQGEMHLRVALERLASRFGVDGRMLTSRPSPISETIRHKVTVRGRHKKQSGGHGQFGDVVLEVGPRERGEGFVFSERVHGGSVPRQYFSSVEAGCQDALAARPARLSGGRRRGGADRRLVSFGRFVRHGVSHGGAHRHERGSRQGGADPAGARAGGDDLSCRATRMSRATGIVSGRRGQIMGFGPREGWEGWDKLETLIPEAEMDNLIVELRSATAGAGFYEARFDHLAEVIGRRRAR